MNSILKICRVGPLLGLITRWHLYRVSRHADAASRSVLPCERFRSLAQSGRSSQRLLSHGWHKRPPIGGFLEIVGWLPIPSSSYSEAKSPTVSGGHLKYSSLSCKCVAGAAVLIAGYSDIPDRLLHARHVRLCWLQARRGERGRIRPNRRRALGNVTSPLLGEGCRTRRP